jgi:hypothetical protein
MAGAREETSQRIRKEVQQTVVRNVGIEQTSRKDDDAGHKIGLGEGTAVDKERPEDAGMTKSVSDSRVQGDDLVIERCDENALDTALANKTQPGISMLGEREIWPRVKPTHASSYLFDTALSRS